MIVQFLNIRRHYLLNLIIMVLIGASTASAQVYKLIIKSDEIPGKMNEAIMHHLPEPVKALAAFYSAMGGSYCTGVNCELTTALGLGEQGSSAHLALIKKYFPGDKAAAIVIKQQCYQRPSGASSFSDFEYLTIKVSGDTMKVYFQLLIYNRGDETIIKGPDVYRFSKGVFKKVKRQICAWADR